MASGGQQVERWWAGDWQEAGGVAGGEACPELTGTWPPGLGTGGLTQVVGRVQVPHTKQGREGSQGVRELAWVRRGGVACKVGSHWCQECRVWESVSHHELESQTVRTPGVNMKYDCHV